MSPYTQDESSVIVDCPVPECNSQPYARGVYMHIWQTDGEGHGERGFVPDYIDIESVEEVEQPASDKGTNYPDTVELENVKRLDTYTGGVYEGTRGIMIHLGQKAGQNNIPENITSMVDAEDFPIVETDDDGNIIKIIEPGSENVPSAAPFLYKTDTIPKKRVEKFVGELEESEFGTGFAEVVRRRLL
jgi:hypothetical protein